ncbi:MULTISPECIES: MBL fold metallo-hydrolase [Streptomyces]|uniref:Metallo-beta-lactamase domain-containing protein n=1 Tax=Streptomyces coelicolor (strain ATCC BAA-471 / A3(2) / M145) TaxID=100226 RepID=Q9XAK5_STRCO|nr:MULTISPECIES: MBL fold metallo-hydrolase [Streptomyces]MBQ0950487.1 MBL fold metallo-hydrolase [Streptomyces sp. RK76]MDX2924631.1 MBL fold metallo-hydrolase [Streptomyces sp. NRRL_B-16638]MDX3318952.1 MBL fold metallo-hydrolase [Streptomyces sp. ME03-5684b]MYU43120.1 MBL fold metallo-hydrolase [Streptomyces sp. SID7813]NSL79094.1 MBL fold metallo-hydrolase [Streptomyces coelicolor]
MKGDLRFTVLGSASPYPRAGNPCSGYLVEGGGGGGGGGGEGGGGVTRLWMDAGSGTLGALREHIRLDQLDGIWISHLHADHCADLLTAYYGLLYAEVELAAPVPLLAPPGIADRLADFLTNGPARSPVEDAFRVVELHDRHRARIGGLTLTSRAVSHGMPAFGVRVETEDGARLAYSGDSAPCEALTQLADDCTVLLCEADSAQAPPAGTEAVHHTPEEAGTTAATAGAHRLVVTHLGPFLEPSAALDRAAARYQGPVEYAAPGRTFVVA